MTVLSLGWQGLRGITRIVLTANPYRLMEISSCLECESESYIARTLLIPNPQRRPRPWWWNSAIDLGFPSSSLAEGLEGSDRCSSLPFGPMVQSPADNGDRAGVLCRSRQRRSNSSYIPFTEFTKPSGRRVVGCDLLCVSPRSPVDVENSRVLLSGWLRSFASKSSILTAGSAVGAERERRGSDLQL